MFRDSDDGFASPSNREIIPLRAAFLDTFPDFYMHQDMMALPRMEDGFRVAAPRWFSHIRLPGRTAGVWLVIHMKPSWK